MSSDIREALILTINPGAVSLKLAVFRGRHCLKETEEPFSGGLDEVVDQARSLLEAHGLELAQLQAVVGRGGFIGRVRTGSWLVDETMLDNLRTNRFGRHASNLGGQAAAVIIKHKLFKRKSEVRAENPRRMEHKVDAAVNRGKQIKR